MEEKEKIQTRVGFIHSNDSFCELFQERIIRNTTNMRIIILHHHHLPMRKFKVTRHFSPLSPLVTITITITITITPYKFTKKDPSLELKRGEERFFQKKEKEGQKERKRRGGREEREKDEERDKDSTKKKLWVAVWSARFFRSLFLMGQSKTKKLTKTTYFYTLKSRKWTGWYANSFFLFDRFGFLDGRYET